ncbi:MAG: hypothetical protein LBF57_00330 [Holosporaceae bacterium]|jgi:dCTP deaminase|nr:hypothetical protein [Holosporaceae bacterium]
MILTGHEIRKNVDGRNIHISPFDKSMLNPNSCDYRIDYKLLEIADLPVDPKKETSYIEIDFTDNGYVLSPNKMYLANTYEEIGSDTFVPSLIGKTSLGKIEKYKGRYQGATGPITSKMYLDFNNAKK